MAFEVACSQCEGRLMVEEAGVIVACPHCGAHLNIEAPAEPEATTGNADADEAAEQPEVETAAQPDASVQTAEATTEVETSTDVSTEPTEQVAELVTTTPVINEQAPVIGESAAEEVQTEAASDETPSAMADATSDVAADLEPAQPLTTEAAAPFVTPEPQPETAAGSIETPFISSVSVARGVSRHTFSLVRNYAIAMTIAVIFLVYKLLNPNMSALESLPDLKPQKNKDGTIGYKRVPEAAEMPPGHLLSLGESQRFGNLRVTPIRITKEPVEFVHHLGDTGVSREPGPEVVKLWFEFENLSTDQHIAPLDELVFTRDERDWENIRSNNFVCRRTEKKEGGKLVLVYELNEKDIWTLKDQHVEQEIAPGEKLTTYVPTNEEGVAQLMNSDEPLIWRVHFRKGYSPKNYGVTTVIEVAFESSDIGAAMAAPREAAIAAEASST